MFGYRRRSLFLVAVLIGLAVCVVSVQAACEKGCDCLTPAEAKKVGYEYCGGTRTSCSTDLLNPKYCYGKPSGAIGCPSGSTSCGGSCVDTQTSSSNCGSCNYACPTGSTCQGGTCVCGTGLTACSLDPYSPVSKTSPKNFICANLQTDESNCGACGKICGSGQSCTKGTCSTSGTGAVQCPSGCECLTGDEAAEKFGGSYSRCSEVQKPCGVETHTDPSRLSSPSVVSKYCFKRYSDCSPGCGCLLPSEASAKDYTLCGGMRTVCGSQLVTGGSLATVKSDVLEKYCYHLRSPEPCAASCSCMDPAKAAGMGYTSCGEEQVPCDSDPQQRPYFCYKTAGETPVPCTKGCSCLNATKAIASGYQYCGGTKTLCGYDKTTGNPLNCFEKLATAAESQLPAEGVATMGLPSRERGEKVINPLPRAIDCFVCRMSDVLPLPLDVNTLSYAGDTRRRIDVLFVPDETYGGDTDQFVADARDVIEHGYATNDAFSDVRDRMNFWYIDDEASVTGYDDTPSCSFTPPGDCADFERRTSFADAIVVLHTDEFRDWQGTRCDRQIFTSEPTNYRTFVHESGHAVFGLKDEYCCDSNYAQNDPLPNIWSSKENCENDAIATGWDPADCDNFCPAGSVRCGLGFWKIDPERCVMRCSQTCNADCCDACGGDDAMCEFEQACLRRIDNIISTFYR